LEEIRQRHSWYASHREQAPEEVRTLVADVSHLLTNFLRKELHMKFVSNPEVVKVLEAPFACIVTIEGMGEGQYDLQEGARLVQWPSGMVKAYTADTFAQAFSPEKKPRMRHKATTVTATPDAAGSRKRSKTNSEQHSDPTPR